MSTYPHVSFVVGEQDHLTYIISEFLNPVEIGDCWDWSESIYTEWPELKKQLSDKSDRSERDHIINIFFQTAFKDNQDLLLDNAKQFQSNWNQVNDDLMKALTEIMEIEWGQNFDKFTARLSFNPICPRYLKEHQFDVFYKSNPERVRGTIIHELSHFLYFEKWKEVFPDSLEKEFDYPHLTWQLSEMVPRILLNNKQIRSIHNIEFFSYGIYENMDIEGKPLLEHLQNLYNNRGDFAGFLMAANSFVKEKESIIRSQTNI